MYVCHYDHSEWLCMAENTARGLTACHRRLVVTTKQNENNALCCDKINVPAL